tara:strand:+ start:787 stop:1587 length:801 start_codon:yes stop_codon:yes gene_type:complete
MKIYTEVIYTWDNEKNELVRESEKSFNYEGEVSLAWPKIKIPTIKIKNPVTTITEAVTATADTVADVITTTADTVSSGATTVAEETESAAEAVGNVVADTTDATLGEVADVIADAGTPNIPDFNTTPITAGEFSGDMQTFLDNNMSGVPTGEHLNSMLTTGINKASENINLVGTGLHKGIFSLQDRMHSAYKEAVYGDGGYADDAGPGGDGTGDGTGDDTGDDTPLGDGSETGFENATGSMLTTNANRKKGLGRAYHSGSGSASEV